MSVASTGGGGVGQWNRGAAQATDSRMGRRDARAISLSTDVYLSMVGATY